MSAGFTGRPLRVLGIDFGSASIKVAAKVHNLVTDISLHEDHDTLPTCLCFHRGEILFGSFAFNEGKKYPTRYIDTIKRTVGVSKVERNSSEQGWGGAIITYF